MTLIESLPNDSVLIDGTMPGSRPTKPMKLPLTLGSWTSVSLVMLPPISFEVTSTSGDSVVTLTVSSSAPTSSVTSIVDGLADFEQEVAAVELLEALELGGDLVGARHEAAGDERAVLAADRLAIHARLLVADRDRDARQHAPPCGSSHPAPQFRRALLRPGRNGHQDRPSKTAGSSRFISILPNAYNSNNWNRRIRTMDFRGPMQAVIL